MKVKKRLFAGMLALAMLLSLNVTAFAESGPTPTKEMEIKLTKDYEVRTGEEAVAPGEILTFGVRNYAVSDSSITDVSAMPKITVPAAEYEAGNTANITVNLPSYSKVGVYTYEITEIAGKSAGVTYDAIPIYLTVLVTRDEATNALKVAQYKFQKDEAGDKVDVGSGAAFTNSYVTGDLEITKQVTGNMGDTTDKYFKFTVTLTGEDGKTYADSYAITGGSSAENPKSIVFDETTGTATIYLKHGETVTIQDLPDGMKYQVVEDDYSGEQYTTTVNGESGRDSGTITSDFASELTVTGEKATVSFVNDKTDENIDTGVYLDNLPYIIVFAGVLAAVAVLVIRRRRVDD